MSRPRLGSRRQRRALTWAAALAWVAASGCAEERAPGQDCIDCGIHPVGILDPASPDFHGAELVSRGWDFALCATCHGSDFAGGSSEKSCLGCHEEGPTACDTCHAERPDTGSHPAHLGQGPTGRSSECSECHEVPASWDAEGHILRAGAVDEAPAEVRFAAAGEAAQTPEFASRSGEPAYDAATGECSNVYCHGDALADSAASNSRPSWSAAGTGQAECGTCHGDPPATHAIDSCATCHPVAAPHIDGALAIGNGPGCAGCHGSDATGAPPRDLSGNEFSTAIGVGAHQSHLTASMGLRGPLACSECHTVPAQTTSPGHIDSATPAEVAMVGGGAWVRETATCESWCHGDSRPVWTRVGRGEVYCGSCHDIRPAGHDPELALTDCVGCHAETVDPFGNILRSGPPGAETSEHMDGEVDADVE